MKCQNCMYRVCGRCTLGFIRPRDVAHGAWLLRSYGGWQQVCAIDRENAILRKQSLGLLKAQRSH